MVRPPGADTSRGQLYFLYTIAFRQSQKDSAKKLRFSTMTTPSPFQQMPDPAILIPGAAVSAPPEAPAGPDPSKIILTVPQLRTAVLEEAGLDEEDMAQLDTTATFEVAGVRFQTDAPFPGSDTLQVFSMFYGDQHDLTADHVPGDVRIYVTPAVATNPLARDWLRYTFNRTHPSMRAERLTQAAFVAEIGAEWYDKAELAGLVGDDDEPEANPS
jgi:hypothetical protein